MATPSISPELETVRAAINKENAQHSTGPLTAEGKQTARRCHRSMAR